MKHLNLFVLFLAIILLASCQPKTKTTPEQTNAPEWKIGIQTYTFHKFTLLEALDKTKDLGLNYAEAYFSQPLGGVFSDSIYLNYDLSEELKTQLKEEFKKRDITLYAFGVAVYDSNEEWEKFFQFAKEMGIHTVTCEPALEQLDFVEQLALKHNIEVAIHNHPDPSVYADPDVLVKALEGRNQIMGVCADIGHWKRTGNDPLEALKKLSGRIKVIHMKDLDDKMEDTIWGTGSLQIKDVLQELKNQKFDGLISIEYESFGDSQIEEITKSLDFYKLCTTNN